MLATIKKKAIGDRAIDEVNNNRLLKAVSNDHFFYVYEQ